MAYQQEYPPPQEYPGYFSRARQYATNNPNSSMAGIVVGIFILLAVAGVLVWYFFIKDGGTTTTVTTSPSPSDTNTNTLSPSPSSVRSNSSPSSTPSTISPSPAVAAPSLPPPEVTQPPPPAGVSPDCNNFGFKILDSSPAGFHCECVANHAGSKCQFSRGAGPTGTGINFVPGFGCFGRGTPIADANDVGSCSCDNGFNGPQCQYSRFYTCNNRGTPDANGICTQCDIGFAGVSCEKTRQSACNGNGNPNMDGTCDCDPHFAGPQCQYSRGTAPTGTSLGTGTCLGRGDPLFNGVCVCDAGFAGTGCQLTPDNTCNGRGIPTNTGICTNCATGSNGPQCQYSRGTAPTGTSFSTATCNGRGDPTYEGACVCNGGGGTGGVGYYGTNCELSTIFQQIRDKVNQRYKFRNQDVRSDGTITDYQLQSAQTSTTSNISTGATAVVKYGDPNSNNSGMWWNLSTDTGDAWPAYYMRSDYSTLMECDDGTTADATRKCTDPYVWSSRNWWNRFIIQPEGDERNGLARIVYKPTYTTNDNILTNSGRCYLGVGGGNWNSKSGEDYYVRCLNTNNTPKTLWKIST